MAAKFISVWVGAGDYFHLDFRCPIVLGPVAGPFREHGIDMQVLAEVMARGGFQDCALELTEGARRKGTFEPCPSCVVPGMKKAMFSMLGEAKEKQADALQVAGSSKG